MRCVGGVVSLDDRRAALPVSVSLRAPLSAPERELARDWCVGEIMTHAPETATAETPLAEAADRMDEHRIGCLPVLQEERLVGIVTQTDVLHTLIELFCVDRPSQRVEIEVPDRAGMLADAARVFRQHKANLLSVIMHPGTRENTRRIVFRAETMLIDDIVRELRAAGHRVLWPPVEDQEPEGSK